MTHTPTSRPAGALLATLLLCAVSPASPAAATPTSSTPCQATGAHLLWGIKATWRSYITGFANGDWTPSGGASYSTPNFIWPSGNGTLTPKEHNGSVRFPGSVHFTGHDGQLDTTMANPTVVLSGSHAYLNLDFASSDMDNSITGDAKVHNFGTIHFVDIDMRNATTTKKGTQNVISVSGAPTAITAAAAQDFSGTYSPGEAFDPISFEISVPAACDAPTSGTAAAPPTGSTPKPPGTQPARTPAPGPHPAAPTGANPPSATGEAHRPTAVDGAKHPITTDDATGPAPTQTGGAPTPTGASSGPIAPVAPVLPHPNSTAVTSTPTSRASSSPPATPERSSAPSSTRTTPSTPTTNKSPDSTTHAAEPLPSPTDHAPAKNTHVTALATAAGLGACALLGFGVFMARRKSRS